MTAQSLRDAFSSDAFRQQGHALIDRLADFLRDSQNGVLPNALNWMTPETALSRYPADFKSIPTAEFIPVIDTILGGSTNLQHPKYLGHQIASPLPLAALCDLAASLINNGLVVYEVGPAGIAIEKAVIRWMADQIGYGDDADGVLTSGGSLGNFTALLAARQAKADHDIWTEGTQEALCVLTSEQSHYSVKKAMQMMGFGAKGVVSIPTDDRFKMRTDLLEEALKTAHDSGCKVFAVVGSACSTATGSYDDLNAIADFCEKHNLWFHVDGAHGGSALVSEQYRSLLNGIHRADSVSWDAHKMLMMPALITGVIFKNKARSYEAFSQNASYLYQEDGQHEWYNIGHRTFECTKRMMALKLYTALKVFGTQLFDTFVTDTYNFAKTFARLLQSQSDFTLLIHPESNIVCFQYTPARIPEANLNDFQNRIRHALLEDSEFYIVQTTLLGKIWLRCTLINPFSTEETLLDLLKKIRKIGESI